MDYNDLFQKALHCFDQGNLSEAENLARQVMQTAPDQPDVLNLMGLIAQARGLHQEACSYFAAAGRGRPDNAAFLFNLAFSLKADKQYAEALLKFNDVLRLAPDVPETHNEIALIYEATNNLDEARRHWQAALDLTGDYADAAINLANSYRHDDPAKAETELRKLTSRHPESALLWYDLAWLAYNRQDMDNALAAAAKTAALCPENDSVYCLTGKILVAKSELSAAAENFNQALKFNANNIDAALALADIKSAANDFAAAESLYRHVLDIDPQNFAACNNYAEMLYRQKRLSEALEEYRRAVIINPRSAEVSNNLGAILKDLKDYDQALDLFFNALNLNPALPEASVNLAETIVLLAENDEAKALTAAENWLKAFPENTFARHTLASLRGENIADNQIFVEKLFDNFADTYELVMQNLDYTAPLAVRRTAGSLEGRVADLGCGSGLVGLAVKTDRNQIIGVDLSAKMLALAAAKNVYNELVQDDILDFLRRRTDFDWILAVDVAGYLGPLDEFISLCRGKKLIFSIESLDDGQVCQIQKNGRFKHKPEHIKKLLADNGFKHITEERLILRNENGTPVKGCIFKAL